jgi:DNA adenine methylase
MRYLYSPLRYPGGKNRLADFVALICGTNNIKGHYVEPYAGGAAVALYLLINGHIREITINDSDRSIYAFWYSVLNHPQKFINKIKRTKISKATWNTCREIQKNKDTAPLFELGFSTFFLNRTNVSGIINGGMIGGLKQNGKYKIDCRFNKKALIDRIKNIAKYRANIHLHNLDALDLITRIEKDSDCASTIFYFDPPYYLKGESLYMDHYNYSDHEDVSRAIQKIKNARWIVSYDAAKEIKTLYKDCQKIQYPLLHTARTSRIGKEVLFFSSDLIVPKVVNPTKL